MSVLDLGVIIDSIVLLCLAPFMRCLRGNG
jgi:hypothetical protein